MISAIDTPWRKAVGAEPLGGCLLRVTMENGEKLELDLTQLITNRKSFWRLKNFRYFRKVAVDPLGGLCWPGREDIAPTKIPHYHISR